MRLKTAAISIANHMVFFYFFRVGSQLGYGRGEGDFRVGLVLALVGG